MVSVSAWVPVVVIGSFTGLGKMDVVDVRRCKKILGYFSFEQVDLSVIRS